MLCFPDSSVGKESDNNLEDLGSIPGLGRSPGEGHGNLLTPIFLPGEFHRGAWQAIVHGFSKSRTRLND